MKIASFLDRADVTTGVPVASKQEVLSTLVDLMSQNHTELDGRVLLEVLMKREELRSTGIEKGVAFPHGRIPGLTKLRACFGRCKQGVDFDSFDGAPTHFFFTLLIPEEDDGVHLRALARLNRLFQDRDFRERLLRASNADAVFEVILEQDRRE